MAVAGRTGESKTATSIASALREATFVRLLADATGDSLAATGLFARALSYRGTPFQASVISTERPTDATDATDDTTTVCIGRAGAGEVTLPARETPASETAFEVCRELDADPDPVLALAGAFTAGAFEGSVAFESARDRELIEQRPGVAIPVTDLTDGLTHTTLAHAPFSGDSEATAATFEGCKTDTDDGRREVASLLALSVVNMEKSTPRAAERIERALRPYAITESENSTGFETVGGYTDVLRASAREQPGIGLALALGHDVREAALSAWRTHGKRAHTALRNARTERHRNLFIAHVGADAPLLTTARLLCDFRSPEPVALVVGEKRAAAAASEGTDIGQRMREAADGEGWGSTRRGQARFEDGEEFVTAFREAVA
ncbi:MAG TPA: exonuclease RecJ [Halococcus sp.]|nr:exonuclease RecJ [Halococcus sp.]